jgi:hypothetical protein
MYPKQFRVNPRGMSFTLQEVFDTTARTAIKTDGRTLIVNAEIRAMVRGWEKWDASGDVNYSFPFLSKSEREFLSNGMSPEEYEMLYGG